MLALVGAAIALATAGAVKPWLLAVSTLTALGSVQPSRAILSARRPPEFIAVLRRTSTLQLAMGAACVVVLAVA